jgi:ABC-2 type transport system permease protein
MRRAGQISQSTIEIIIIIGIVVVLNLLGWFFHSRFDFTKDKEYTLAPSSKEMVSTLPDRVSIKAYVSPNLPPDVQAAYQGLKDLLDEYAAASSNNLSVQIIHTNDMSKEELTALEQKGIEKRQHAEQSTEGEQATLGNYYMGLEIDYLGKSEIVPFAPAVQNLEYKITSSILKLTSEKQPGIGFLTGHGEGSTQQNFTEITKVLKDLYNVQDVDLGSGKKIDENINTLVIPGPTQPLTERHKYAIDQFLMRGGKLVILQTGYKMNQQSGQAEALIDPMDTLMSSYGIKINNDVVIDLKYPLSYFDRNTGGVTRIPPIPVITAPEGFPSDSPATRGITSMALPLVSSISLLFDKIPKDTIIYELAKTSEKSYSHPLPINLADQNQTWTPPGGDNDFKSQLVAVQLTGLFKSAFQGKAIPALDPDPQAAPGTLPEQDTEPMIPQSPSTSIVVIGNTQFLDDQLIKQIPGVGVFFMNLMEALNIGDKLIDIRTRTSTDRPLNRDLKESDKNGMKFWGYGAVPILITLFGVARFYLKSQRKRLLQAMQQAEK